MNTNKTAYWIALGVLALGLNSEYRQGNFVALHRVAERAGSVLCRAATRAEQTLAVARLLTSRQELLADSLASADTRELARDKAELVREQAREQAELLRDRVRDEMVARADVMRARAEVGRAEMEEQIRLRVRSQYRLTRTVNRQVSEDCPEIRARVAVNDGAEPADASMDVEVDDNLQ